MQFQILELFLDIFKYLCRMTNLLKIQSNVILNRKHAHNIIKRFMKLGISRIKSASN